jgi:membrane associated rhomboid family serine protease
MDLLFELTLNTTGIFYRALINSFRFITPIVLHVGIIHWIVNMLVLFRYGYTMERTYGWWRFGIVYIMSGLGGVLCTALFLPGEVSVATNACTFGYFLVDIHKYAVFWVRQCLMCLFSGKLTKMLGRSLLLL